MSQAIVAEATGNEGVRRVRLSECLQEVTQGIGSSWKDYRVLGATRAGLAPAKEAVGKQPERYKLVQPGTIFYNPMRILIGSIAFVDEGAEAGITSPDYVVFRSRPGIIHPRWFYYWLRSDLGAAFSRTLARGAVRERMLFRRLAAAEIFLPPYEAQLEFANQVLVVERARAAAEAQLETAKALPATYLRAVFNSPEAKAWPNNRLGNVCELLPARSIATDGDTEVLAITTACLTEGGFQPSGVKTARMRARDAAECVVYPGEVLIARSNTPELVGRVAMFAGDPSGAVASDLTIRLRTRDGVMAEYLAAYLSSLYATGYWKERAGGASGTMKKITRSQIQDEQVPVPSEIEQHRLTAMLSDQMAAAEKSRKALEDQLATINKLPAALLRRAFSGEL